MFCVYITYVLYKDMFLFISSNILLHIVKRTVPFVASICMGQTGSDIILLDLSWQSTCVPFSVPLAAGAKTAGKLSKYEPIVFLSELCMWGLFGESLSLAEMEKTNFWTVVLRQVDFQTVLARSSWVMKVAWHCKQLCFLFCLLYVLSGECSLAFLLMTDSNWLPYK